MSDKVWDIIGRLAMIGIAGWLIWACYDGVAKTPPQMCLDLKAFPFLFGIAGVTLLWGVAFRWKVIKETFGV